MKEIENQSDLKEVLSENENIVNYAFQGLDLKGFETEFSKKKIQNCLFLGCELSIEYHQKLIAQKNIVIPNFDVPFKTSVSALYTKDILYNSFDYQNIESYYDTYDRIVYDHYTETGKAKPSSIYEALARRLHDHSITDALMDKLNSVESTKVIAIMGGHSLSRESGDYLKIAKLAKTLSEKGYFLLSGGGPGAMEATHLGVWFAEREIAELEIAMNILKKSPTYDHEDWLSTAFELIEKYPRKVNKQRDVGIPTWLYGHEPPTPFASLIAKYFANSVREEGLLALAKGGVIYAPGSAGTIQEIFQDATQNHYKSYEIASPMIFLNSYFWEIEKPVYPLLKHLATGKEYLSMIRVFDTEDEIVEYFDGLKL
ncbi:MAG: hypothetical protein ABFS35_12520 [Bacteroidota bacterium]